MADADASYDFKEIPNFIKELESGFDMVIGNRFAGKMQKESMTFSHKYIGNPILSFLLRLFFKTKIKDSQCGMRAIKKDSLEKLNLQTTGMEFASEMIIKALKNNLKIKELPIDYLPRIGETKMRSFQRRLEAYKIYAFIFYCSLYLIQIKNCHSWQFFTAPTFVRFLIKSKWVLSCCNHGRNKFELP